MLKELFSTLLGCAAVMFIIASFALLLVTAGIQRAMHSATADHSIELEDDLTATSLSSSSPSSSSSASDGDYDIELGKRSHEGSDATNAKRSRESKMPDLIPYNHENENDDDEDSFVPEFTDAGKLDLEAGGSDFVETSWDDVDTGDVYIRQDVFKLYTRNKEDKQFASESIRFCIVWCLVINPMINGMAYCAARIAGVLIHIIRSMQVFVVFYSRGAAASGRSWARLRAILMNYEYFRILISKIEKNYRIGRGGLILNQSGQHRWHQDKFLEWCDFRAILSLLCSVKIMWFKDSRTGAQFGILVPHGAFIVLTRIGSGVVGTISHKVTGADNSFIFALDFGENKKQVK